MLFRFARPEGFAFEAGQSMNVTLVDPPQTDAKGNMRTFSIVSAPFEPELAIATRMRDSAFKRVLRALAPGAPVKLRGPGGKFTWPAEPDRAVVLVAGGIGVSPFVSMLRHAARESAPRPVTLLYSNRRPEDAPFLDELQRLAGPNLRVIATMTDMAPSAREWNGERARIDGDFIARHADGASRPLFLVAGPPGMVAAVRKELRARGVPDADVRADEFFGY